MTARKLAQASAIYLGGLVIAAVLAPWLTRAAYEQPDLLVRLQGPSWSHWMGTDSLGRDLYGRILHGARLSLAVGGITAIFSLILGILTGAIAGYRGGRIDAWITRIVDSFMIFPSLLLAILIMLWLGQGLLGILLALGLTSWVTQARLVRGLVLQAKELAYVESARALGASESRILFGHIVPNILGPIIVALTFQIPSNIMAESFLSFIGLGIQPPHSSWGTLASEGFRAMRSYPHLILFPGAVLFFTLLAFNFLGDGIRDWLDPKRSIRTF